MNHLLSTNALPAPEPVEPDLSALPVNADRRKGAELVTRFYFPVSPRTIERWRLPSRVVGGKAIYSTAALLAYARGKMNAAPVIMSGSASKAA
ncbi:hypothetical protein [Muricoccus radiodurans]|uniref:hypothetical protein n=1 Tax=Muricoccus radiodurans TaxID=2231721 RepID=UPI003CFA8944